MRRKVCCKYDAIYLQVPALSSYGKAFPPGFRRPSWAAGEIRWCDGPDHRPNAGAWAGVVKAETEIKTNGVS